MQISRQLTWQSTNWPGSSAATQYTLFQMYPGEPTPVENVEGTTSTLLTYDDTSAIVYQIRPSSGDLDALTVGPELLTYVIGYVPCLGWLRQKVRMALADRADSASTVQLNWPDDEINTYVREALGELNVRFPIESNTQITLQGPSVDQRGNIVGTSNYALPEDFYLLKTVEYVSANGELHYYLREKTWKGGESTATSFYGYPKLGILFSPMMMAGRIYPGHYQVYENQVQLDWSPAGDGDYLNLNYLGRRPLPTGDADILQCTVEDMELLSLYTQMKCWLRVEVQDARLSRWRGNPEGSTRDGLPTVKHWIQIKQLYNERVNDRLELRPRSQLRLVRR
jgi:hypothetical protein